MKSSKGITVLALAITVVVIVIITSITVYTGVNAIEDARQKGASDKLKVICNEIRKNDNFLDLEYGPYEFEKTNFEQLNLQEYYDDKYPVQLEKIRSESGDIYTLKMFKGDINTEPYAEEEFIISNKLEKNTYIASFDELKGVNSPILYENMYALKNDGVTLVNDIYEDNWYDYLSAVPSFAKMQYGSGDENKGIFVWIPRFAYSIQNYYNGDNNPDITYGEVPSSAIKIIFLRENTDCMANGENKPIGFNVHPAFSGDGQQLAGIWVALNKSGTKANLSSAISETNSMKLDGGSENVHLMTNSEFGAALYLMHALNSYGQINFSDSEYVAAMIKDASTIFENSKCDIYELDSETTNGLKEKLGDAMLETNWNRSGNSTYMTNSNPFLVRALDRGLFDFDAIEDESSKYYYRPVITP